MTDARPIPSSTYRLQLYHGFTFQDAEALLDYFRDLGITHLYLSPITAAAPGSMHGYDVADPSRVNPELGGEAGLRSLAHAARDRGLGLIVDIVPNHMSTAEANWRWMDVLRNGKSSTFAPWFDVDWEARDEFAHRGKVLLPVLGAGLDEVLTRGELTVDRDAAGAWLRYYERRFPLAPGTDLAPGNPEATRTLLDAQHYVLEYWLTAKAHVDYRRFFTVDELIGVRVEDPEVFAATHELYARLSAEGLIEGVRVDHADGLSDPATYFRRLRDLLGEAPYVIAEKILGPDERLPDNWPIDGTTGYEFMADVAALQTDDAHREDMARIYMAATGRTRSYDDVAHECRLRVLDGPLTGQLRRATRQLYRSAASPVSADAFAAAVRALMACLPVYRTYHNLERLDPRAADVIRRAERDASRRHPGVEHEAIGPVAAILARPQHAARLAVMRLQQLMPAVAAKAIEDSAFYRYIPLLSLNEVGSDPVALRLDAQGWHARNEERARRWPASLLATATHDHKRGEDVRARLSALSEQPNAWRAFLADFHAEAGPAPAPLEEYRAAQTLVGIWPADGRADRGLLRERLAAYLVKASREAAERTSWDGPDPGFESALETYAAAAVEAMQRLPAEQRKWLASLARDGITNSLAAVVLRVCSPGVPDTYQGAEGWDGSLVDPDNRRPVDYAPRIADLEGLRPLLEDTSAGSEARRAGIRQLTGTTQDARLKLYVLARSLRRRRALHPLCVRGDYLPLEIRGVHASHALAFARRYEARWLIAAVVIQPSGLSRAAGDPADWADTLALLPTELAVPMEDAFTGIEVRPLSTAGGAMLPLSAVFRALPVALLEPAPRS
ncbi:MAG: malto-oligosyltrehalose synthase [Dehalococcoidia bacterium]